MNIILKKALNIEPEYISKKDDDGIYLKKSKLFEISKLIINSIKENNNEINQYVYDYTNKYKNENLLSMEYNIYKINNLFLDNEMDFLINELKEKFKSTIEMHKNIIDYNHELGMAYVNELNQAIIDHTGEASIGQGFYGRYQLFVSYYTKYVNDANSEEIYNNLEFNFNKIKEEILDFIKIKLSKINDYSFEKYVFKDDFYFIIRMNKELYSIFDKINKYFNKERFISLKTELYNHCFDELQKYSSIKNKTLVEKYEYVYKLSGHGLHWTPSDYEYHFWRLGIKHKRDYNYLRTTNNIEKVNLNTTPSIEYVKNETNLIIENFKERIDQYLSKYINYVQNLYDNIYINLENKINCHNYTEKLFNKYEMIYNDLLDNNSNYGLLNKLYNKNKIEKDIYKIIYQKI